MKKNIKEWKGFVNESITKYEHYYDEEMEMHVAKPSSLSLSSTQYNEIVGEYNPIHPLFDIEDNAPFWISQIASDMESLEIPDIVVMLAMPYGDSHIASVVNGAESSVPIFCLNIDIIMNYRVPTQKEVVQESILHELGHAYIRNSGVEYEEKEEEAVELYAKGRDKSLLDEYIRQHTQE